jgi:HlyD family secretion protein
MNENATEQAVVDSRPKLETALGEGMDRRVARASWRYRRAAWIAGGVAVLILAVLFARLIPPPGSLTVKASDLEIGAVQRAPFQDYLPVRGEVAPLHTVFVGAVEGGQVASVIAQDGDEVRVGQALATLTNPQLKLDVISKEAEIAGRLGDASGQTLSLERNRLDREKEISDTSYNLLKAQHDLDVRQRLHDQGFVSDAEVKTFADQTAYYQNRLKTLKSGQQQEDAIAAAQSAEDALTVRAPVAGRLTDFILQPGQSLKAGDPIGQIDSEGAYKLIADIDEFYLGRVSPGQTASADIDGRTIPLVVSRVLPQVTNGRFRAELTFAAAAPGGLRRGEAVDIRITLGDTKPALVAPNGGWLEAGGGSYAFVLDAGGHRADRRAVVIGRRNPEQVEITAGLRAGERIVTSSYAGFDKSTHLILH